MRRLATLALTLVLPMVGAACGDDSKAPTKEAGEAKGSNKEQYLEALGRICNERFEARMLEADPRGREEFENEAAYLEARSKMLREQYVPVVGDTLDALEEVDAPEDLRQDHMALVEAGRKGLAEFETLFQRDPNFMDADTHPDPWQAFYDKAETLGLGDQCAF